MSPSRALARLGPPARGLRLVRPLHRAATKRSYLVERRGERFVLRIDEPLAARWKLDRAREVRILAQVQAAGVGPRLVAWALRPPAVLLLGFVPGRAWRDRDLADPHRLIQIATLLRAVHSIRLPGPRLDLAAAAAAYARQSAEPTALAMAESVRRLLDSLGRPEGPPVLCHHDPVAANIVGYRAPLLIDWEYAAAGDPGFDLAAVIRQHRLGAAQARRLLDAYYDGGSRESGTRLAVYGQVYERLAVLWLRAMQEAGWLTAPQRGWLERLALRVSAEDAGKPRRMAR